MKKGESRRGFNQTRKIVRDKPFMVKFIASCNSCRFQDDEGVCRNGDVTYYDVVEDGNREFCLYWRGYDYDNGRKKKEDWWDV